MSHTQILNDLKNKVYKPIYFLFGEEPYYIDLIADYIEDKVLDEAEKEFNQTVVYGKDTDIPTIIAEAKRYPMMANHNVVIVKEAQNLDKQLDQLESYVENATTSTILVFCYKYKKPDGRKGVTKKLKKAGEFFESKKLYDNQVPNWITDYLSQHNYKIEPKAAILITEFLGTELSKIANELDKTMLNLPEGSTINSVDVEKNIGISKDFNAFELNNAIGERNIRKANQIVFYFANNQKAHPIQMTLGVLYGYFSNILTYHYTQDKSKNNIASKLGVNPYFIGQYQTAARNYSIKKCVKVVEYLRDYDVKSKGIGNSSTDGGELLKELIFKIIH